MERIDFDHNATTQVHPMVVEAMLPFLLERYGNPSSLHWYGQEAHRALDQTREQVADLINAFPDEEVDQVVTILAQLVSELRDHEST